MEPEERPSKLWTLTDVPAVVRAIVSEYCAMQDIHRDSVADDEGMITGDVVEMLRLEVLAEVERLKNGGDW